MAQISHCCQHNPRVCNQDQFILIKKKSTNFCEKNNINMSKEEAQNGFDSQFWGSQCTRFEHQWGVGEKIIQFSTFGMLYQAGGALQLESYMTIYS